MRAKDDPPSRKPLRRAIREAWQNHAFAKPSIDWGGDAPGNDLHEGISMTAPMQQQQFRAYIADLVRNHLSPMALGIESTSAFPQAAYELFARDKLFNVAMPAAYGGMDADASTLAYMVETISSVSPSSALLVFPSNAVVRTIAKTGTEEQQERFFADLADGAAPLGFCLTEPDHGSDAASMTSSAKDQGDHYLVSGTKSYITLGPNARYYLTFVRTGPGPKAAGISALMIPRDAPGLSFGPPEKKLGLHGSVTTQMFMDEVPVPKANRLWGEGEGWRVLTEVANPMRAWGAAAMALGISQGLLNLALDHAMTTRQGEGSLMRQQAVAFDLADMKVAVEASRSLVYRVCDMLEKAAEHPREVDGYVSMAKCFAGDTGVKVAELAGRVMGQAMVGSDSLAGRLFCCAKAVQIFDGSNQVQRLVVARHMARNRRR
jgi:alkylation response protein AidB-like acyl-CoA dehydrogenase